MITPLRLLRLKKKEITDQYNIVLNSKYGNNSEIYAVSITKFEEGRVKDLAGINKEISKYNEAINILMAVRNNTF